jgi:hypothetical protein
MTGARGDDRVRIRFEEEERSSEGRDLFLDFDLEAGMLDEVDDKERELLGNEVWELLGNEMWELLEGSAKPEWGSLSFFSYHAAYRGRMPRNNKNSATSNSNQFELLVIEEDGTDDNTGGGTSAASVTPATSMRGNARSHTTQSQYS